MRRDQFRVGAAALASLLLLAYNIAPAYADECRGNCPTTTGTPSTFVVDPVISPTVAPTINPTIAPVIAPTNVTAPVIAPTIAPRVDSNNTNLNANNVRNDNTVGVGVGVGVSVAPDIRNTTANVVSPDQRNSSVVTVAPTISPRQDQTQGQTQGQNQTATATSNQTQAVNNGQTISPNQSLTYNEAPIPADTKTTIRYAPQVNAPGLASAINNDLCVVSASLGGSGIGFGIGIGLQFRDEDCVRRVNARQLFNFGFGKAALLLMAQDAAVRQALQDAGVDLGNLTLPEQPKAQVTTYTR